MSVLSLRNGRRGFAGPGQDLVNGANGMVGSGSLQNTEWPYFWTEPGVQTQFVQQTASMAVPATTGTLVEVIDPVTGPCEVQVPSGMIFILRAIQQYFTTGVTGSVPYVDGSGDLRWTIDVSQASGGAQSFSSYGLPYLSNMANQRGQLVPWPLEGYNVFNPYQVIRYKVLVSPTSALGPSSGFINVGLFGWFEKAL